MSSVAVDIGRRIAEARRRSGLTQRDLARSIGLSLWQMERIEHGDDDGSRYVTAIAVATSEPEATLRSPLRRPFAVADELRGDASVSPPRSAARGEGVRLGAVLGTLAVLLVMRFFTEVIHVLPKAATFVDVPLFLLLVGLALTMRRQAGDVTGGPAYAVPALVIAFVAVVSAVANASDVAPGPALMFLYGFLAPLAVYHAVYRLWPVGHALALSRLIIGLATVQLLVVAFIDIPRFLPTRNPDLISGTFGDNAYQLVFFLLVATALLAAMMIFEPKRLAARLAPVFFLGIAATIFLAQFRALLVTTILTILLVGAFLSIARGRGLVIAAILIAVFVASLSYVGSAFPEHKFNRTITSFKSDPWYFVEARIDALSDVASLYGESPRYILVGSGPGTFSSRAWRTFADLRERRTTVAAPFAAAINREPYRSSVAERYTVPRLENAPVVEGSYAVTQPFSSYSSLLAEVGLLGFFVLLGTYLAALLYAARIALAAMRSRIPADPLPGLALAATIAFTILFQLAALDNWLEVTRITFLSWAVLAVVAKEGAARQRGDVEVG